MAKSKSNYGRGTGSAAALLLAIFLISGTAWADDPGEGSYWVFGAGYQSCGHWTASKEKGDAGNWQFVHWLLGYLTAYSLWVEDGSGPVTKTDGYGAGAWIDIYCQEHPLERVADAAEKLIVAIKAK